MLGDLQKKLTIEEGEVFHLRAIVSRFPGHYVAFRKVDEEWVMCDDGRVTKKVVENELTQPYMLFYVN